MSRKTDGPDYDFGPYEDEYRGFEIRDDETGRGPLILVLALGVLLIFGGVVWNTYRQGVRPSEGGLPILAGDTTPYKRAPDERGGLKVAGQDNGFYGQMDGMGDPALVKAATVRNPPQIKRSSPVLAGEQPSAAPEVQEALPLGLPPVPQVETAPEPRIRRSAALDGLDERLPPPGETEPARTASLGPISLTPRRAVDQQTETLSPQAGLGSEVAVTLRAATATGRFSPGGAFQVQLMAVRSDSAALAEWDKARAMAPDLFDGAALDVQRADLGAKGVFYRLRVGAFESRAGAQAFCVDVKAAGKDCIVVAKAVG